MRPWKVEQEQTGRKGYREPDEPPDGRPVICRRSFWTDESERLTYEHAAETNPRRPGEGAMSYVQRLAQIAAGRLVPRLPPPAKPMPRRQWRFTDAQVNERENELRRQAQEITE